MQTSIVDTNVQIAGTRKTAAGFLAASAKIARAGIYHYGGHELGRPDLGVVRVFRPADEVFAADSMATYGHKPVTVGHPPEDVSADNWKQYSVGTMGSTVARDGDHLEIGLLVCDAAAIKAIENGTRGLSAGYRADITFDSGATPNGEAYDAVMKSIRANHLAIVPRGRAGSACRIGDSWPNEGDATMTTNVSDGLDAYRRAEVQRAAEAKNRFHAQNNALRAESWGEPAPQPSAALAASGNGLEVPHLENAIRNYRRMESERDRAAKDRFNEYVAAERAKG